jgi:hypothetical protein
MSCQFVQIFQARALAHDPYAMILDSICRPFWSPQLGLTSVMHKNDANNSGLTASQSDAAKTEEMVSAASACFISSLCVVSVLSLYSQSDAAKTEEMVRRAS